ncbi:hypothetical protein [Priestia megaterium]|uniref:hypothetical protein n=1 Tax=Priestia megaterium TaxID=1404 RepID=UPI001A93B99D|nr:hypothetical protein [Priestia megaterium]QSX23733.1 hypothetical protein J0P05_28730 [Priestia megaterium]
MDEFMLLDLVNNKMEEVIFMLPFAGMFEDGLIGGFNPRKQAREQVNAIAYQIAKNYSESERERENKNYSNCIAVVSVECANDSSIFDGAGIEGIVADGGIAVAKIACGRIYKSEPSE